MCIFVTICFLLFFWLIPISLYADNEIHLTLIPPAIVTNQVDLDIRGGVVNKSSQEQKFESRTTYQMFIIFFIPIQ